MPYRRTKRIYTLFTQCIYTWLVRAESIAELTAKVQPIFIVGEAFTSATTLPEITALKQNRYLPN